MERSHINWGPGRIYGSDGKTLFDVQECSFDMTTTPGPGPAGDVRFPSFLEPLELSLEFKADLRLLAALTIGWRAKGHPRWVGIARALNLRCKRIREMRRKRSEIF